jgi:hypothetical protein
MQRLPESTCERDGYRARCSKNTPGALGRIVLRMSGTSLQSVCRSIPGCKARRCSNICKSARPGRFQEGQLRTLQRRIKNWRALEGPPREVFFAQEHYPGELCQSDFTHCRELGITINGQAFPHLIYHFVLSYSNWETGTICYSETFESLSEGLQNALWELGGVPNEHRTDRMRAAVNNLIDTREFTRAYEGLLRHYGLTGQKIQAGEAHENGDVRSCDILHLFATSLKTVAILMADEWPTGLSS